MDTVCFFDVQVTFYLYGVGLLLQCNTIQIGLYWVLFAGHAYL